VERSQVRYSAAGLLIALGLLVGGTGGVASADPGGSHQGSDGKGKRGGDDRSSDPTPAGSGGVVSSERTTSNPHRKPPTKFGTGRDGPPSRKPSGSKLSGSDGPAKGDDSGDGVKPTGERGTEVAGTDGKPGDKKPGDNKGGDNQGKGDNKHDCLPGFPFPILLPTNPTKTRGWLSVSDYFKQWTNALQNVPIPSLLSQPRPQPAPNIRSQIAGPEPVNTSGGGGGGTEPVEPAAAEPPVLKAPPIAVPPPIPELPPPVVVPAPPVVVPAPPGGVNTWLGPRALPEPPATGSSIAGQPVPPAAEPPPTSIGTPIATQASHPAGYTAYLPPLELTELAAASLPGVGGILLLTAGGSFIGYRQAKAGQSVRTRGVGRFLQ
jgi:hypothetical protein